MLRPIALGSAHMECRYLSETVPVLTDLLAFEKVAERPGEITLKHPNTGWLLVVHEAGPEAPKKQMHNHFGVRVSTEREVDAAHAYLTARREAYRLTQIGEPAFAHGSYSFYFLEPGTNGWEVECYERVLRKEKERARHGGVRAPHWQSPLSPQRFPDRDYTPQGFTHGTLACGELQTSWNFYDKVLGLEVHQANDHVVYVKHPKTPCYVVCAVRPEWKSYSPNFRFTVVLQSRQAVSDAHGWLSQSGKGLGVTELGELRREDSTDSFLLSDPDKNWWGISSPG